MNRKEFIKTCSYSCMSLIGVSVLAEACRPLKYVQASTSDNKVRIAKSEFAEQRRNKTHMKRQIIVKTEALNYPIVLYRFSETDFSALLLQCTHQANELSVNGDLLTCAAHGSEFTNRGEVVQGPADQKLKSFKVTHDNDNIYIHLT